MALNLKSDLKSLKPGPKSMKHAQIAKFPETQPEFLEIGPKTVRILSILKISEIPEIWPKILNPT